MQVQYDNHDEQMKKLSSRKSRLAGICIWIFAGMSCISLQVKAEESRVAVSAAGKVSVKPDMAEFSAVVKSDAKTSEKAAADTAEKYRTVQNALRTAGIPSEDATSAAYSVSPRWEWDQSLGRSVLKGYTARHTIMVKVRNLGSIGKAIDASVQGGADEVQNISFSSSRYESLRQQALAAAVENARRDADIMARAAGGRLGQLLEAVINEQPSRVRPYQDVMALKAAPEAAPTEIAPSEQEIVVTVNTRWRFIGGISK